MGRGLLSPLGQLVADGLTRRLGGLYSLEIFPTTRFLYRLRMARISPKELLEKINAGEQVMIVDLRQPLDIKIVPYVIPGALRMAMKSLNSVITKFPAIEK
jgi:hypothetical protein